MSLNSFENYGLANELLALKARVKIIAKETGLSSAYLRKTYSKVHHTQAPSGQLRADQKYLLRDRARLKEATIYVFYFRMEDDGQTRVRRTINAYRRYVAQLNLMEVDEPEIDFSTAYVIGTWVTAGTVRLVRCGHCRSAKLSIATKMHRTNICPVCKKTV